VIVIVLISEEQVTVTLYVCRSWAGRHQTCERHLCFLCPHTGHTSLSSAKI